jgi:hypothetical protein
MEVRGDTALGPRGDGGKSAAGTQRLWKGN